MWEVNNELSDSFLNFCLESSSSQEKFNNFRRDPRLHPILEHVEYDEGILYLNEIKNIEPDFKEYLFKLKENDLVGNPFLYDYPNIGFISPTTIRYIKNIYDIASFFYMQLPKIKNIVEIGGGYGGLSKALTTIIDINKYTLIDFKEVNKLSKKYLNCYYAADEGFKNQFDWIEADNLKDVDDIDLCISNYAFSECNFDVQKLYYKKYIKNSKNFYITYNFISNKNMSLDDFKNMASNDFYIFQEDEIRSSHTNYILYGFNKKTLK